jgi:hypothetical protein
MNVKKSVYNLKKRKKTFNLIETGLVLIANPS